MKYESISIDDSPRTAPESDPRHWRELGWALGLACRDTRPHGRRRSARADRRRRVQDLIQRAAADSQGENAAWVVDNFRLIFSTEREVRPFALALREFPVAAGPDGLEAPRVCLLAKGYLEGSAYHFCERDLIAFLEGYQQAAELQMNEIWALKPALELELIDRLTEAEASQWPALLTSLRKIGETAWKEVFEAASLAHGVLARDPAGAYSGMDFNSRDQYRRVLADMAKHSSHTEKEIAEAAIGLSEQARSLGDGSRAAARRMHVGFYLLDRGRPMLEALIGYRPSLASRIPRFILRHPTGFYLTGIELLTLAIVFAILCKLDSVSPAYAGVLLLFLPATQAAADFMNRLTTFLVPPRVLPKLDFSEGIPDDCVTMVAVPTLLQDEAGVHDLVLDLEIRYLANRGRNLYFALLTDFPDSDRQEDQRDTLVGLCARLIEGLNVRYRSEGHAPFLLLHRHRRYNHAEGHWMGWERKRGKLLDLNQLLRGGFDAFPVKVGDLSVLPDVLICGANSP